MASDDEAMKRTGMWGNPPKGSVAEFLVVAMPLIISSGSVSLMFVCDRVFLTWYSQDALAAAMPAGLLHLTIASIALGVANYTNTFVAQYEGAGRKQRVSAILWQGNYLAVFWGIVLVGLVPWSRDIFELIGHEAKVIPLEAEYFSVLCCGSLPIVFSANLGCFFSGRGQTSIVMWVNVLTTLTNVGLDYCLIFGKGPFPELGIRGAAIATVTASCTSTILFAALMTRGHLKEYDLWKNRGFDAKLMRRYLRFGFPNGMSWLVDLSAFSVFILLVGKLGADELAATNLAFNINSLAFVPMLGVGIAVSTLVGQRIGEEQVDLASKSTWIAFTLTGAYMIVFAVIYVAIPDLILYPYLKFSVDKLGPLREQVIVLLRFIAVYTFFDAMVIVFGSAIRGAGDTRFSLIFSLISSWLIMVLPTYLFWTWYGGDLELSWTVCTVFIIFLGIGFLVRFMGGKWKTMRVIEANVIAE
ncbi:MAG: MATE family efflux transporter [Planctomycetaceae bacterium]|nr:MATE family efflux transporter [Planctomycetaceae bacterium]